MLTKLIGPLLLLLAALVSGIALGVRGRPYGKAVGALHKLAAVAGAVWAAVVGCGLRDAGSPAAVLLIGAAAGALGLIASGALLAAGSGHYKALRAAHSALTALTLLAAGAAFWLMA